MERNVSLIILSDSRKMAGNFEDERDTYIRRLCWSSVIVLVVAFVCVIIGVLSIVESAPHFLFPYCLGGAAIAGLFVILLASCNLRLYCNYVSNGRVHAEEDTVKRWVFCQILPISLTMIALMLGLGMSGIWGMVQATDVINFEAKFNMASTKDVPYAKDNLVYAICSFVFVLVLSIVQISVCCICLCYTDTYGFTDNAHYSRRYRQTLVPRPRIPPRTDVTTSAQPPYMQTIGRHEREGHIPNRSINSLPDNETDLRVNIPINYNTQAGPSAPSLTPDPNRPPPQYDQLFEEEPPPSYKQVVAEGAFKVSCV